MKNKYKQRTKLLGIPVVGAGDHIWPELELKKWQIVENILVAAMRGLKNCLFEEGDLRLESVGSDEYAVFLRATGRSASAKGVVSGFFFHAPRTVCWKPLKPGRKYYLYFSSMPKTYVDPSQVRAVVSAHKLSGRSLLPVAVANLKGDEFSLETQPEGKVFSDNLVAPMATLSSQVVKFKTGGEKGVVLSAGGKVSFVQISQMAVDGAETDSMGDVQIGYHGFDANVERPSDFCVYNKGKSGLVAKALVFCG